MAVEAPGTNAAVTGAIRHASRVTGTNFQYLVATAQVESRFNPTAAAPTSSARGPVPVHRADLARHAQGAGAGAGLRQGRGRDRPRSVRPIRGDRSAAQRPDHEAAQRPDRQCGDGRRLHQGQCGQARRPARPQPDRGRALRCAFPRLAGRRPSDLARRSQAGHARRRRISRARPKPIRRSSTTRGGRAASPKSIARWSIATLWRATIRRRRRPSRSPRSSLPRRASAASRPIFAPDTAELTNAYAAAEQLNAPLAQLADTGPVFHGLFRTSREAVAPVVSALWTAPTPVSEPAAQQRRSRSRSTPARAGEHDEPVPGSGAPTRARCSAAASDRR